MRIGLFIPCYIDQFYPHVGMATVDVLERYGVRVEFPEEQTCCGQPLANAGLHADARPLAERFLRIFSGYDYIVSPSGSCVAMVRHHFQQILGESDALHAVAHKTFELCEFLTDVLHVERLWQLSASRRPASGLPWAPRAAQRFQQRIGWPRVQ